MGQADQQILKFNRMFKRYDDLFRAAARTFDIPSLSLWVLYVVRQIPDCAQKDIAEILCSPKQSVHSAIKQLVADGCIEFAFAAEDRRCKSIRLTDKGAALASRTADPIIEAERRAFAALSAGEREALLEIFERLFRNVEVEMNALTTQGGR